MLLTYSTTIRLIVVIAVLLAIVVVGTSLDGVTSKAFSQVSQTYFEDPRAIAVDSSGDVFVTDMGNQHVLNFSPEGKLIRAWGGHGSELGKFSYPYDIAIDSSSNVYVSDRENHRIQKFSNTGDPIRQWGSICNMGTGKNCKDPDGAGPLSKGDGQFLYPQGVTLDKNDNLYVVDSGNGRIQVFTKNGEFKSKWGTLGQTDGKLKFPTEVTVDYAGYVYVVDSGNNSVHKIYPIWSGDLAQEWVYSGSWGGEGTRLGYLSNAIGIDHDPENNLYLTDSGNDRVQKFKSDGTAIDQWGGAGTADGKFHAPSGIALSPDGNMVYVVDTENKRVQKFDKGGNFVLKWGPSDPRVSVPLN